MDVKTLQRNLTLAGRPATVDGVMGAQTMTALLKALYGRSAPVGRLEALGPALANQLRTAGMWTPLRLQHFLAQAAHETTGFLDMEERGGPSYFAKYDGRADLGNIRPGDGARYHGRGIFQLTGRANYRSMGRTLGLPLEENPVLAADPVVSVRIAVAYWLARNINAKADADDLDGVTRKINGGLNGLADRRDRLAAIRKLWGAA
ncbi:glycoside hydrolase family 19 protein [Brevundimonas sp.]|uniref:glycoside hydrolase family 19 protein n=1 Tax=Brevundimonas sp. TaxID=1871086 RepID=UPI0028A74115|nr:glycoside hydrolase family 19 protein [Brevundimonas sp.]